MRLLLSLLLMSLLCACSTPPETKVKEEATEAPAPPPRVGVVGLVQESRVRAINEQNFVRAITGILRGNPEDSNANVAKTSWEVTIFFETGQQEMIVLDYDPLLRPGQKVRVTGKKIEVITK